MRTIYKYSFGTQDKLRITSDYPLEFLTCQYQRGVPTIWALVKGDVWDQGHYEYEAVLVGTGWDLSSALDNYKYLGTIQESGGLLIWHCFVKEVNSNEDAEEIVW